MDGTKDQDPLVEATIQVGGGVCVNKYINSLSQEGWSHRAEKIKRESLGKCR